MCEHLQVYTDFGKLQYANTENYAASHETHSLKKCLQNATWIVGSCRSRYNSGSPQWHTPEQKPAHQTSHSTASVKVSSEVAQPGKRVWHSHLDNKIHKALVIITGNWSVRSNNQSSVNPCRQVDMLSCTQGRKKSSLLSKDFSFSGCTELAWTANTVSKLS